MNSTLHSLQSNLRSWLGASQALIFYNYRLVMLLLAACTVLIYWPGMSGGFYFDDYPNIVHNAGIPIGALSFEELYRAAFSSGAGPLMRPLPMASFAINHYFSQYEPASYKITNLVIHLLNAGLLFVFFSLLLQQLQRTNHILKTLNIKWLALFATAGWVLHPLNATNVLYVVQRMNSMAMLFSLFALIGYLYYRPKIFKGFWPLAAMFGSIALFGLLAILSKENALLLPVFILLLEFTLFQEPQPRFWKILRSVALLLSLAAGIGVLLHHLVFTDWAIEAYRARPFNLKERVLTEGRILWHYWGLILLPDIKHMGLYLDDVVISKNLFFPLITPFALLGHLLLIALALIVIRRHPVITLGILWFYIGHLLESTIFPLEMKYEHRNYLPMIGPIFAATFYIAIGFNKATKKLKYILAPASILLLVILAGSTALRAEQMGDPWGYPFYEAEHHPLSTRANFFAGRICGELMREHPNKKSKLLACANRYLTRSAQVNLFVTEPLIALAQLHVNASEQVPTHVLQELEARLHKLPLNNDGAYIAQGLLDLGFANDAYITDMNVEKLFNEALSNPLLQGENRAHMLTAAGIMKCEITHQRTQGMTLLNESTKASQKPQFAIVLATYQFRNGLIEDAKKTLSIAEQNDYLGIYKSQINTLKQHSAYYSPSD